MVFEFFKISVNVLSIDRAGCLEEASESEPLGLLSSSLSTSGCITMSCVEVFALFLACVSQGMPCCRGCSCVAISMETEQSSLMVCSLMPRAYAEEVRRFLEQPRPKAA